MTATAGTGSLPREVAIGDGRILRIRQMAVGDAQPIYDLYTELDADDRYRRFFTGSLPTPDFVERLVDSAIHRGGGLVVEVVDGDQVELVGEATYVAPRVAPADGGYAAPDFAITIARPWRGWLGAYLLDALLTDAHERGVENVQADVLTANGPMLALLRKHGYATVDDADWTEVRAILGTCGAAPAWPEGPDRPHLLVEGRVGRWLQSNEHLDGIRVWRCPTADGATCPALRGEPCPLVSGADAIVIAPVREDDRWARLAASHSAVVPEVAVFVDTGGSSDADAEAVAAAARRHHDERQGKA